MQFDFSELKGSDITGFNTASGRYYCNASTDYNILKLDEVSIPQAVGTIAIVKQNRTSSQNFQVSIPQAVGTIAIS